MLGIGLNEDAGRTAYLAGLHAVQAFAFETTGRVFKKHSGVQREFARLAKDEPSIDTELRVFLPRTYNPKAVADYETGPGSTIPAERARGGPDGAPVRGAHCSSQFADRRDPACSGRVELLIRREQR
jgi:hypothetical protein